MPLRRRSGPFLVALAAMAFVPAQEPKREAEDLAPIRDLLPRIEALCSSGEHEQARRVAREALAACLALPGLSDRADAHALLFKVARAAYLAGERQIAHDGWQRVCEYRTRTLPDDHPGLQAARAGLAVAKMELGDLVGARPLFEKVYEVQCRRLPDDHPDVQAARANFAVVLRNLGDRAAARALDEKVYEVESRTLPDDHPDLQSSRSNLAVARLAAGDVRGAQTLFEKVYEIHGRTLPDDDDALQNVRLNLATTKSELGDLAGARALQEKVHEVWSRTRPDDHPDLQRARNNLAITKSALGDVTGARALRETVHAIWSRTLPDDHPDLQRARTNLARTKLALGDLAGALELQEKVYEIRRRTLPDGHPDLQAARTQLAWTHADLGAADAAVGLARERAAAARQRLSAWVLAPREIGAMAAQESEAVDQLLTLIGGYGEVGAQPDLAADALVVTQALRGLQTRAARASRRARSADPERVRALEGELRAAAAEVSVAGASIEGEGEELETRRRARSERLTRAVHEKERIERELAALAAEVGHAATLDAGIAELAAAIPEHGAAAAIVAFAHQAADAEHPGNTIAEARLAALVLARTGSVTFCPLGPRAAIEDLVDRLRIQVGAGRERGLLARGSEDPLAVQKALRARVLDPIVAAAGDVDTLWLSVDETLELVPLDALSRDDGTPLGTKLALRPLVSLFDLLEPAGIEVGDQPTLLAIGGLDYDTAAEAPLAVLGEALPPPAADTRSGPPQSFAVLLDSRLEVRKIAHYFGETFADAEARILTGTEADKATLFDAAPRATFVHCATHGYFAPERVRSTTDIDPTDGFQAEGTLASLSPLVLCGLALSGANLPADDRGRHAGILTAEEILSLDLSHGYLVTLSACDTSLGVRRAGQGYASLRAALQGAGARFVMTSLWKVGDETTMALMVDFYRRLWLRQRDPHAALWEAKMEARRNGAPFRDWAGWVLTGR